MGPAPSDDHHDQVLLREHVGARLVPRAVLHVSGPDATDYLQGQLSQDVAATAVGDSVWSLLLQPRGRLVALVRVSRLDEDTYLLDSDEVAGDEIVARLERFKLRTAVELRPLDWRCVALRGPDAPTVAAQLGAFEGLVARAPFPRLPAIDLLGPDVEIPDGVAACSAEALEALRIEDGMAATGRELTGETIPAEAGAWLIDEAVSFTKGCYTGQELVVRIHSRGNTVPRPVRGLVLDAPEAPPPGTALLADGATQRGRITSAAFSTRFDAPVALAVLARSVPVGAEVRVGDPDGPVAVVHEPPL